MTLKEQLHKTLYSYFLGQITENEDFCAGGTPEEQLMGMAETLWEPDMTPDDLFECVSQEFDPWRKNKG